MTGVRRGMVVGLILLTVVVVAPLVVRWALEPRGPAIEIVLRSGSARRITLDEMHKRPTVSRRGEYQNQFSNWRDAGTYAGVRLTDLIGDADYEAVEVVAADGYRVTVERARIESADYPMILAYAFDGVEVPQWTDGFRIAVLPEDGRVSNEEYDAVSAGSYWVKNVVQLIVH